jgi:uncharacterized protein YjbJ (UPF0337 family)
MNKDQANGALKNIGGRVQQSIGKVTGNKQQQVEGLKNQAVGKAQAAVGDTKAAIKDIQKTVSKGFKK